MVSNSLAKTLKTSPLEFDYQATTPCCAEVVAAMEPYWSDCCGNPSSRQSRAGLMASSVVSLARDQLAACLKINPERLIFTSGATEANNLALLGHARARAIELGRPGHLITLRTEHRAVLDPLQQLQREGFRLTEIGPDSEGLISTAQLLDAFEDDTILVSVMVANNEIGVVQPIGDLARACRDRGVTFHTDAAQGFGHLSLEPDGLGLDLVSLSGHKFYGPKGIGALVIRSGIPIVPLHWGGGQEQGLRPGTIPVPLVVGFAKAAEMAIQDLDSRQQRLLKLRNQLWEGLTSQLPDLILNGSWLHRLPNNLNFSVPGVNGNCLHQDLRAYLACSSGSACTNGKPSHVLMALGRTRGEASASLRMSLGRETSISDVQQAILAIVNVVRKLRKTY